MQSVIRYKAGFTLIELILVLVLAGILSFSALRFLSRSTFDARGYADQVASMLRFAQKEAIAKRRNVCVNVDTDAGTHLPYVQITFAAASFGTACDPVAANNTALPSPSGDVPFRVNAPSGLTIPSLPITFSFDSLGRPSAAQTIQIQGDIAVTLTVEAETGYVHQ